MKTRIVNIKSSQYFPFFSRQNKNCDTIILSYLPPQDIDFSLDITKLPIEGYNQLHYLGALYADASKVGWDYLHNQFRIFKDQPKIEQKEIKSDNPAISSHLVKETKNEALNEIEDEKEIEIKIDKKNEQVLATQSDYDNLVNPHANQLRSYILDYAKSPQPFNSEDKENQNISSLILFYRHLPYDISRNLQDLALLHELFSLATKDSHRSTYVLRLLISTNLQQLFPLQDLLTRAAKSDVCSEVMKLLISNNAEFIVSSPYQWADALKPYYGCCGCPCKQFGEFGLLDPLLASTFHSNIYSIKVLLDYCNVKFPKRVSLANETLDTAFTRSQKGWKNEDCNATPLIGFKIFIKSIFCCHSSVFKYANGLNYETIGGTSYFYSTEEIASAKHKLIAASDTWAYSKLDHEILVYHWQQVINKLQTLDDIHKTFEKILDDPALQHMQNCQCTKTYNDIKIKVLEALQEKSLRFLASADFKIEPEQKRVENNKFKAMLDIFDHAIFSDKQILQGVSKTHKTNLAQLIQSNIRGLASIDDCKSFFEDFAKRNFFNSQNSSNCCLFNNSGGEIKLEIIKAIQQRVLDILEKIKIKKKPDDLLTQSTELLNHPLFSLHHTTHYNTLKTLVKNIQVFAPKITKQYSLA